MLKTVLLVEGDADARQALERQIEAAGYRVVSAPDGIAALRSLEDEEPWMIVIDCDQPGAAAPELCRHVRSFVPADWVAVIAVTADDATRLEMQGIGADDCLMQPASPVDLAAHLRLAERVVTLERKYAETRREHVRVQSELDLAQHRLRAA